MSSDENIKDNVRQDTVLDLRQVSKNDIKDRHNSQIKTKRPQKPTTLGDIKIIMSSPTFRPLRLLLGIWVLGTLAFAGYWAYTLYSASPTEAATTVDNSQANFDAGTYNYTQWNGVNSWVESTNTNNILDTFPENATSTGWIDMTGNTLLYHLDESSGSVADTSGNNNTGTVNGGPTYSQTAKMGTAIKFDGVNDYIDTGENIDAYTTMTVSLWLNPHTFATSNYIFDTSDGASGCGARLTSAGQIEFFCYSGGNAALAQGSGLTLDTWHHIVFVMTPTGFKLYKDGASWASASHTNTSGIDDSGYTLKLGSEFNGTSGFANISLDEVAVWNRELSTTEIHSIYEHQKRHSGSYTSAIKDATANATWNSIAWTPERPIGKELSDNAGVETAYTTGNIDMTGNKLLAHLNEASGTITDSSGQGNSGTYNGALYAQTGKLNDAIGFDGSNDWITFGDIDALDGLTSITAGAWVRWDGTDGNIGTGRSIVRKQTQTPATGVFALGAGWDSGADKARFYINNGSWLNSGDSITSVSDGQWHYVVGVYDGTYARIYVDGTLESSTNVGSVTLSSNSDPVSIGAYSNGSGGSVENWNGLIDEVAVWNRALSATEIANIYKRGVLNMKYQVRSCNDSACNGESFAGPDGTASTYYEWGTTNTITTPTLTLTNVPDNQYFQYKAFLDSHDASYTPELKSVTVDYTLLNVPPNTPTNSSPTNGATLQVRNTTLSASAYSDADSDAQTNAQWEVDDNSDFSSPEWTRTAGSAETSTTINSSNGTFANNLSGATQLAANTTYYFRVRYHDGTAWSTYSTGTSFTTEGSLTITAPASGNAWAVGSSKTITWSYAGSPATTVTLKADSGDGNGFDYTIATGVSIGASGTGSYSWTNIPSSEQGTSTKVRIISDQQSIQDDSDTYKIVGGLTITSPNGSEYWIALTPSKTISWTTSGSVSSVDIFYSTDGGSSYPYTIATSTSNTGSYSWTLPDLSNSTTTKIKIVDSSDSDAYDESDADFTIRYASMTVNVQDSSTSDHLSSITFNPGDGTGAASKSSPFTYSWPYGSFDIVMDKVGYNTKTTTQSITTDGTLNLTMTAQSVLNQTKAAVGFETDTDTLKINAWLELNGAVISNPTSAEVWIENNSGTVVYNATSSSPSSNGTFHFSKSPSGLPDEDVYQAKVKIINDGTTYISTTPVGLLKRFKDFANASVYIDSISGSSGTVYPMGNQEHPVDNITDALTIGSANSLTHYSIRGPITVPGSAVLRNCAFSGSSANVSSMTLGGGDTTGASFDNLTLSGTVNGDVVVRDSFVNGLSGFTGVIFNSAFTSATTTLTGSSNETINIIDSRSSVAGTSTPIIDFGGSGHNLSLRGYSGGIKLINKTGSSDSVSMDFVSGHAIIDTTCTAGTVVVRGNVELTDNSNGCNVINTGALSKATIADSVLDEQLSEHTTAGSLGAAKSDIITEVNANETKIDTIDTVVDTIASTTVDTNTKVTDIQTKVTDIQSKVNSINTLLSSVDTKIDSLATAVSALRSSQQSLYNVELSGPNAVQVGNTYRTKLTIEDYETTPTDADSTPTIVIYDASRAVAVATTTMTSLGTGEYEYTYALPTGSTSGLYESDVTVVVGGNTLHKVDYWQATGAPSQVIINSISDSTVDSISADITISNEGNASYEYQYEWCVVDSQDNQCGGNDDIYYGQAAKLVTPGVDFNKTLTATVPDVGDYWFKVVNYYGTESSSASRSFTAVEESVSSAGGGNGPIIGSSVGTINQLQLTSQQLIEALDGAKEVNINVKVDGLKKLLQVSEQNTETLKDVQNKLSELKAVSNTINAVVTNNGTAPIVETFMKFNSVELHFIITNPSDKKQLVKFKQLLPKEATPESIMNADGLKVEYDPNAQNYFVSAEITLGGGESITKKVEMTDIWVFDLAELANIKKQAESYAKVLSGTQYEARGTLLVEELKSLVDSVAQSQATSYSTPQRHIVVYRNNVGKVKQIDQLMNKLKDLVTSSGASNGLVGSIGGIQTFSTWGIVLAIVFGFGLLAAIVFAMWRQQTLLITALGRHGRRIPGLRYPQETLIIKEGIEDISAEAHDPETFWGRLVHIIKVFSGSAIGVLILVSFPGFVIGMVMLSVPAFMSKDKEPIVYDKNINTVESVNIEKVSTSTNISTFTQSIKNKGELQNTSVDSLVKQSIATSTRQLVSKVKVKDTETGWLNVRGKPSASSTKLGKVLPGKEYVYEAQKDGWYYIIIPKGIDGWVSGEYVEVLK